MTIPSASDLMVLPTIGTIGSSDLKYQDSELRVFLNTTPVSEGAPYNRTVYVEQWDEEEGDYEEIIVYDGDARPLHFPDYPEYNDLLERMV